MKVGFVNLAEIIREKETIMFLKIRLITRHFGIITRSGRVLAQRLHMAIIIYSKNKQGD